MSYQRDKILIILPPQLEPLCWLSKLSCMLSPLLDTPTLATNLLAPLCSQYP